MFDMSGKNRTSSPPSPIKSSGIVPSISGAPAPPNASVIGLKSPKVSFGSLSFSSSFWMMNDSCLTAVLAGALEDLVDLNGFFSSTFYSKTFFRSDTELSGFAFLTYFFGKTTSEFRISGSLFSAKESNFIDYFYDYAVTDTSLPFPNISPCDCLSSTEAIIGLLFCFTTTD